MTATARQAAVAGFPEWTMTLTVGRQKKSEQVVRVGREVAEAEGVPFLAEDFKKRSGFDLSVIRSRELSLRRQEYCGCALSRRRALLAGPARKVAQ
jgi:hypothetical protein